MFATRFAQFVLRGRTQASVLAVLFSMLPYLGWVSSLIVGLVTLRKGAMEGLLILLWAALPSVVIYFHWGSWIPLLGKVAFGTFCVWLGALILRSRAGWGAVLQVVALIGVIGVIIAHSIVPDISAWWLHQLSTGWQQMQQNLKVKMDKEKMSFFLLNLSYFATGFQLMLFSFIAIAALFFARGLEALLFNPGNLSQEVKRARVGILASVVFIACIVLSKYGSKMFIDFLPVLSLPFLLAGLSLSHAMLAKRHLSKMVFSGYYMLLIAIMFVIPQVLIVFVVAAIIDSFINIRARWAKPAA